MAPHLSVRWEYAGVVAAYKLRLRCQLCLEREQQLGAVGLLLDRKAKRLRAVVPTEVHDA